MNKDSLPARERLEESTRMVSELTSQMFNSYIAAGLTRDEALHLTTTWMLTTFRQRGE